MKYLLFLLLPFFTLSFQSCTKTQKDSASVSFSNIKEGDKVSQSFLVEFVAHGMKTVPAGQAMDDKKSGHHHILIDNPKGYIELGQIIPADEKHIHFGKGQTEAKLTLSPGKHKLSLQFADGAHKSYGKALATSINIVVN